MIVISGRTGRCLLWIARAVSWQYKARSITNVKASIH